jgi:hypothetical protein
VSNIHFTYNRESERESERVSERVSESENRPNEALDYFEEMELMGLEIVSERKRDGKGVRE